MYLIAELCGQHGGSLRRLEQMTLQAKASGADAVKLQLYDTYRMPGVERQRWEYLGFSFDELKQFKEYCDRLHIDCFASPFDEDRFEWCMELDFPILKVASYVLQEWPDLAEKMVATGKRTLISLGMFDYEKNGFPFKADNVEYLYCVSKYPGTLEDIHLPDFSNHSHFVGYSDHTPGNTAVYSAITRGAKVIEKHFTTSKALQQDLEKGHFCSMDAKECEAIRNFSDEYSLLSGEDKLEGLRDESKRNHYNLQLR
jgi:N,N'-diacetyllegionaminate synthase